MTFRCPLRLKLIPFSTNEHFQLIPWPQKSLISCITQWYTQNAYCDTRFQESKMAAGRHLEFWLNLQLQRCPPCLILKLRDPITHFKRESLCNSNCKLPLLQRLFPIKLRTPCILIVAKNLVNDMKLVHHLYLITKYGMNSWIASYVYKILEV